MNTIVKDNLGYINIPNDDYFYFELNKLQLKIFSARSSKYRHLERTLNIQDLIMETSFNPCKGGVEDVGNFSEGYCFMLKYTHFNRFFVWELCADNSYEKEKWMSTLSKLNAMYKSGQGAVQQHSYLQKSEQHSQQSFTSSINMQTEQPMVLPSIATSAPHFGAFYNSGQNYGTVISPLSVVSPVMNYGAPVIQSIPGIVEVAGAVLPTMPMYQRGPIVSNTMVTNAGNALTISTHHGPGWMPDGAWSVCSEPCGPGVQVRKLKCVVDDGCFGDDQEEKLCKLKDCKKDLEAHLEKLNKVAECGQWKLLGDWTPCSKPCGGGFQLRKRECIPANLPCVGKTQSGSSSG